jgi:hypothetical protein
MKPLSWDKQLGLVSPLKSAAIQSGQTNHPSKNEVGLDVSHHIHLSPEGRGKYFFLDILFHRMSVIGILQQSWHGGLQSSSMPFKRAIEMRDPGRGLSIAIELDGSHRQLVLEYLYGLTGGFSRSQCSTHFTVLTSTSAFLCPEKLMSGRMNSVCGPLATLKEQLKLIDCTPRSLHPV